jgi:hypothetical protein
MFHPDLVWVDITGIDPAPAVGWTHNGTTFAAPVPPIPTPSELLATRLAVGIAITSTGTPALDTTYSLDQITLDQIGSVARDAAAGLGLPLGASTFSYPDITGSPRSFTSVSIRDLYKAMRDLVFELNTQAAIATQGGTAEWPVQSVTIA